VIVCFAARTLRARLGSYAAPALVLLAGTTLLTAFASLLETGLASTVRGSDTLTILPAILGGWAMAIVVFGVVSTTALVIASRSAEIALLRSIAATPAQIRRLVVAETMLVAVPAVAVGLAPGVALGAGVLDQLAAFGVVPATTEQHAGWLSILLGAGTTLLAALVAAGIAGRRAAAVPPARALRVAAEAPAGGRLITRARGLAGAACLAVGLGLGAGTLLMTDGPLLASTAGPAGVAAAVGLALLCPAAVAAAGRLTALVPAAAGRLAGRNVAARATRTATAVGPLILLVGIATGTLYMQDTENATGDSGGAAVASGNYLAVAMIIAFSVIAVLNTLVAATRQRAAEFDLLHRTGATRRQVYAMVAVEAGATAVLAILLGSVAALVTTVPYNLVRTGSAFAAGSPSIYLLVVAGTLAVAFGATLAATRRALPARRREGAGTSRVRRS
jgi:putative ABC transport system permease protein